MARAQARAPRGQRATTREKFERGAKLSAICALRLSGAMAPMVIEGSFDQVIFDHYVEFFLLPTLRAGDRVMLDNIRFHHSPRAISLIGASGAQVEHLPAYSPDFNPLEECISKLKSILRRHQPETPQAVGKELAFALTQVTPTDIEGWFSHCGYKI